MACFTCAGRRSIWRDISRAAAKAASARLRALGGLSQDPRWPARATICAACPVRTFRQGHAYCGEPFLSRIDRDPTDGCGCPIKDKAKDPSEHCPINARHRTASTIEGSCNCKWCSAAA